MSLITQCPACTTMFKVVPDQLRISDGWVRCGQCDEVFDANANLHSEAVESPREPVATTSPDPDWAASLRFASDDPPAVVERPSVEAGFLPKESETPVDSGLEGEEAFLVPDSQSSVVQARTDLDEFLSHSPADLAHSSLADHEPHALGEASLDPLAGPAPRYTQSRAEAAESDAPKQPSFMHNPRDTSVWHTLSARVALGLLGAIFTVALGAQVALHERDRWAAYVPATVPVLQVLCEVAGCTLSPLRNIDALVIDSSSFTKVRSDVYRLNVAFKNTGAIPVAPPALELTLTDMQDQSLMRRVLKPHEIGFKASSLDSGAEFSAVLPIYVKTGSSAERVSGYRLLAFYP